MVKNPPAIREAWVQSLGWEDPLEEEMAPSPVYLPGESPWTEEPGKIQFTGLQRVRHYFATEQQQQHICSVCSVTQVCPIICVS